MRAAKENTPMLAPISRTVLTWFLGIDSSQYSSSRIMSLKSSATPSSLGNESGRRLFEKMMVEGGRKDFVRPKVNPRFLALLNLVTAVTILFRMFIISV